jgi:aminoglycoside phosphotransferase family enzyme
MIWHSYEQRTVVLSTGKRSEKLKTALVYLNTEVGSTEKDYEHKQYKSSVIFSLSSPFWVVVTHVIWTFKWWDVSRYKARPMWFEFCDQRVWEMRRVTGEWQLKMAITAYQGKVYESVLCMLRTADWCWRNYCETVSCVGVMGQIHQRTRDNKKNHSRNLILNELDEVSRAVWGQVMTQPVGTVQGKSCIGTDH